MKRIVLISLLAVVFVACQDGTSPAGAPFVVANFDHSNGSHPATFLIIDEESIGTGREPNFFSGDDVNEPIAAIGLREILPFFADNVGETITLHTGGVGDEGWFALTTIPGEWDAAGPTIGDGLRNYIDAGPGLGSGGDREALLDKVPGVTPLRATGLIFLLKRSPVCAVVYKGDVSINYAKRRGKISLDGSLKGDNLGIVAFEVLAVTKLDGFSLASLPKVDIKILDAVEVCGGPLTLFTDFTEDREHEPISSSEPFDVDPADRLCEEGFFGDPEAPGFVCAGASLPAGESLDLVGGDGLLGTATVDETALIAMLGCTDLRDRASAAVGKVDLRTFGTCVEIISLDLLPPTGIARLCNPFTTLPPGVTALSDEQIARMTVHRFGSLDASAVALPHSAGPECPDVVALELNGLERFVRFARNTWRAVSAQVRAWIEPAPLWAKMAVRCNRGGCSSVTGFRSSFQVAQPAWMDFHGDNPGGVLPSAEVATTVTGKILVQDSGELPSGTVLEPAEDVRLTVTVTGGGGSVSATEIFTDVDGIAVFELTLGTVAGTNTVTVEGIGVGTLLLSGSTVMNVFAPSIDGSGPEVELGIGTLTFTATGTGIVGPVEPVELGYIPNPPSGTINLNADGFVTLVDFEVCAVDEDGVPVGVVVEITSLIAIKNNGTPVILGGVNLPESTDADGCFTFTGVTINKAGAYRLVVNGEFVSLKFNVKPAEKKKKR